MVAQVRGAQFDTSPTGEMYPSESGVRSVQNKALDDVAEHLGFSDADDYLEAAAALQERIWSAAARRKWRAAYRRER